MTELLTTGYDRAATALMLAPGAGAPATSPWMERMTDMLASAGLKVLRFDFSYMVARRTQGSRRPPPAAEVLVAEYVEAVTVAAKQMHGEQRLLIGGKSMGGRVASLAAQSLYEQRRIAGLVCLGYPFHPPKKPDALRTAHLVSLSCPTLIVQGERDPFGGRSEVDGYALASSIAVRWARDGDHDFTPRRSSGTTLAANMLACVEEIPEFAERLG